MTRIFVLLLAFTALFPSAARAGWHFCGTVLIESPTCACGHDSLSLSADDGCCSSFDEDDPGTLPAVVALPHVISVSPLVPPAPAVEVPDSPVPRMEARYARGPPLYLRIRTLLL